ncbi:Hsp20/alpha crystallin family protein [Catellatospora vulcania]|uniref:Hsp20/alpha crystallin family protein n=1 Tax=Catellatospora vulcania TaxID=1460450 RepID=UPI001E4AA1E2|nr:Hsp20/alpha crystallin family protein [Catellatospora vulcania]
MLHLDLPGIDPGTLDASVDGSTLTITAQRSLRTVLAYRPVRDFSGTSGSCFIPPMTGSMRIWFTFGLVAPSA